MLAKIHWLRRPGGTNTLVRDNTNHAIPLDIRVTDRMSRAGGSSLAAAVKTEIAELRNVAKRWVKGK